MKDEYKRKSAPSKRAPKVLIVILLLIALAFAGVYLYINHILNLIARPDDSLLLSPYDQLGNYFLCYGSIPNPSQLHVQYSVYPGRKNLHLLLG